MTLQEELSTNDECFTPVEYIRRWCFILGIKSFDLDPCHPNPHRKDFPAKRRYTKKEDGLVQPWGVENAFINPPYGSAIGDWIAKGNREWLRKSTINQVWLVPSRTDTAWFHELVSPKMKYCVLVFAKPRIKFLEYGPDGEERIVTIKKGKDAGKPGSPKFPNVFMFRSQRPRKFSFMDEMRYREMGLPMRRFK